jgi:hypothetical protein
MLTVCFELSWVEMNRPVSPIAEGLIRRMPAAAQGSSGQFVDGAVLIGDAQIAAQVERAVRTGFDSGMLGEGLLETSIQASETQGANWAFHDRGCDLVGAGGIHHHPGPPDPVKNLRQP